MGIEIKDSKIYVAGHRGLVGSAIVRRLKKAGSKNLLVRTRQELDLFDTKQVEEFFKKEKPEYVFMAAAKVGGIVGNSTYPAEFIHDNLLLQDNIIHASYKAGAKKLLFPGSSCIYPKFAPQPIKEEYLLSGPLEETNKAYAIAKIAGIIMCQAYDKQYGTNFVSAMSTSLYGPGDNFDLQSAHVIPSMMRKFHEAKVGGKKEVMLWGNGTALREFLHVDDFADAAVFLMQHYDRGEVINVGTGEDVSIKKLAELMKKITGFKGKIVWDKTKPNGTPRKLLDVSKIHSLGWHHSVKLKEGLSSMYEWYKNSLKN